MMLQNGNNLSEESWPSFCSSCKSDLRSFFRIGVPSYLDESVSSILSAVQDVLQSQESRGITNNENEMMQSAHEMKIRNWDESYLLKDSKWNKDKNALSSNSYLKSLQPSLKHTNKFLSGIGNRIRADEENISANLTLIMYETQQLNDIRSNRLHDFLNLKNHTKVATDSQETCQKLFENLKLLSTFKSCNFNMQEIKSFQRLKYAINIQNLDRWKKVCDILWKRNVNIQAVIAPKTSVNPETTETVLENRRNVYKLAVQVAKFSTYIRKIHKLLLKKKNVDKARIIEGKNKRK